MDDKFYRSAFDADRALASEALRISSQNCQGGFASYDTCNWYHGSWPALRTLGVVSNPYWHLDFFRRQLIQKNQDIAVLGTADFSLPFLVDQTTTGKITIFDICNTPLDLCRIVSRKNKLNWEVGRLDIRADFIEKEFDLIINDAFLTRFPKVARQGVLRNIGRMLRKDGVYATTVRIRQPGDDQGNQSTKDRRTWFVERAMGRFDEIGGLGDLIDEEKMREMVSDYMKNMKSHRVECEEEIIESTVDTSLKVENSERVIVPGESEESVYLRFVMRKV